MADDTATFNESTVSEFRANHVGSAAPLKAHRCCCCTRSVPELAPPESTR